MTDTYKGLIDFRGNPIERNTLTEEIAAPTLTGVRSPLTSYPGDGLNPGRLASILKEADAGDPLRYLELAETIEERDPHYAGVMGTRKRSVSQLDITVEAGGDTPKQQEHADMVRNWVKRDELADEIFDMLDAIGKGYSFTEILWDTSAKQYEPARLDYRDPRWFRFSRIDGQTPMLLDEGGMENPLPAFKFIQTVVKAKSGLPVRSGLARIVAWAYMFKMFTGRDWAIFTQNYGQPIRVGKYGAGATAADRRVLYNAVANIAGDCAAIIPESMAIEFIEAKTGGTAHSNYMERSDWLDRQVSKAVIGQTATTDAVTGGLGSGKEHRQVQEDIERADAKALSAIINRDLIRPWIMLNDGPQDAYPRLKIGRAEQKDVKQTVDAVTSLVPFGYRVGQRQMQDLIGIGEPDDDDELLTAQKPGSQQEQVKPETTPQEQIEATGLSADIKRTGPRDAGEAIAEASSKVAQTGFDDLVAELRDVIDRAASAEEAVAMLEELKTRNPFNASLMDIEDAIKQAMLLAELTGREEMRR